MRRILGPFKNTNILIFKGKAAPFHYWVVLQDFQGGIADHPIAIEFPLCALHFKLVSFGANKTLEDAMVGVLSSLAQYHFPHLSGHEQMELSKMTWRTLTAQEKATYHFPIGGRFPILQDGDRILHENPMFF